MIQFVFRYCSRHLPLAGDQALGGQLWTRRPCPRCQPASNSIEATPFNQRLVRYGLRMISEVGDSASDVLRDRRRAAIVDHRRRRFSRDRHRAVH
jgi:hypothetical protein